MDKQMEPLNQDGLKAARYEMEKSSVRGDKLENAIRAYLEQTPTLPAGKVEAVAERNEVLIEAVDSVMNCAAAMGIKLRTNHGTTEENAWQLANAALKASGAEHIAGLVAALRFASGRCWPEVQIAIDKALEALPPELRGK